MGLRSLGAALGVGVLALVSNVRDANACGGCFHPQPVGTEVTTSVITDHRMVFKISANETILWDQVRYSGDPKQFAWVLPIRAGATIELSRDEFIGALDATTKTTVNGPIRQCTANSPTPVADDTSGCGSSNDDLAFSENAKGSADFVDAGANVSVVSQEVIGPYEAVTLHSNNGLGISDWLTDNAFAIPDNVKPIIDAYTKEGFDFIALKLEPDAGVQAMRPVRVISPGSDVSLPLRMVAAGVGATVGMTLWVIGEGRYDTSSFPHAVVNDADLKWDGKAGRSNLTDLETAALATNDGRTWITEQSQQQWTSLEVSYQQQCIFNPFKTVPCSQDQLPLTLATGDGGVSVDAGVDTCTKVVSGCDGWDDLDRAAKGLNPSNIWITRLRADLPAAALSVDLTLAAGDQAAISGTHQANAYTDPKDDPCPNGPTNSAAPQPELHGGNCDCRAVGLRAKSGTYALIALTAFVTARVLRRRRYSGRK